MNKLSAAPLALLLAGCASTPHYDTRFGDAVRHNRLAMTITPRASANPDPVAGLDGQSAHQAHIRYEDSFKTPPPVVPVINIGGVSGNRK